MKDANGYVKLAEEHSGEPIARPQPLAYPWGAALHALDAELQPHVRLINLETTITASETPDRAKAIQYRMSPSNAHALSSARLDAASLANNHILDWSFQGLLDSLAVLHKLGIRPVGASSSSSRDAAAPARIPVSSERNAPHVLLHAAAHESSGLPPSWAAAPDAGGVNLLRSLGSDSAHDVSRAISNARQQHDVVSVFSLHVSPNWGYDVPQELQSFAETLIDSGAVNLVWCHSRCARTVRCSPRGLLVLTYLCGGLCSHHAKALHVHNGGLICYGVGDLISDYIVCLAQRKPRPRGDARVPGG
jgi:poly-gamma-glutamate synthesis protein (capsule biosynthesis protein)